MKSNLNFFLILSFGVIMLSAQTGAGNIYAPSNKQEIQNYLEKIQEDFLNRISGNNAKKIKQVYRKKDENILEEIEDSAYVFYPALDQHLGEILNEIYATNPKIDHSNFKFFINSSFVPNAACYGDGMFEVNLGLMTLLESDDALAFVLSHEIAHLLLDHSLNRVSKVINSMNSKETKKKVRDIKRQKYGRTRAAMAVIDDLTIDLLNHSKEAEAQADSLGYLLLSNTKYNAHQAINALSKLEVKDEQFLSFDIKVDSLFNLKSYPFQSYWLEESISLFDIDEKIDEFSLKSDTIATHPEVAYRIEKLKSDFQISQTNEDATIDEMKLLKEIVHHFEIKSTIDLGKLDISIYLLREKFDLGEITETYYYNAMSTVLREIYLAKKKHSLGKRVPQKNSLSEEKQINEVRLFLHNLELNEIAKLGLAFCQENQDKFDNEGLKNFNFFQKIKK